MKTLNPKFEEQIKEALKQSIESGKFAEISKNLDPDTLKQINNYYFEIKSPTNTVVKQP